MSEKEMLIAVFKAVIASAKATYRGYLQGSLSFKENDDDKLMLSIAYLKLPEGGGSPEMYVRLPWLDDHIRMAIRDDSDLNDLCLAVIAACDGAKTRVNRWYLHRNLPEICAMLHIDIDSERR